MLRSLGLRNFRAFKHQHFEFSKLNIFVGPNNSGKSSAISAINLLAQTFNDEDTTPNPFVPNGQFDRLGTFLDLVHGNRSNTPLGMDVGLDRYKLSLDFKYRQQRREIELVKYEISDKKRQLYQYSAKKDGFELRLQGQTYERVFPKGRKRRPDFYRLTPEPMGLLRPFSGENYNEEQRVLLRDIDTAGMRVRRELRSIFSNFDSISPFRDRPERTYLYSGETAQRIGTTGSNTAMILANDSGKRGGESIGITEEISRWFKSTGIAEGIKVKSLTPRHFEMVLFDSTGAEHNICDVGFGCSQVLPVLTAALKMFSARQERHSSPPPLLIVQEPEIHLHPNAQAALGSFFTRLLLDRGQVFIETHSDNLVLRVARHVAEGTLAPGDVKIFYVHRVNDVSEVINIEISEGGRFVPNWPGGFFPQRQLESLSVAQAAHRALAQKEEKPRQEDFVYPEEKR